MKIITKCVWEWHGDELVKVEEESYEYEGPVALAGGGDTPNNYYEELNKLYAFQRQQGEYLMGIAKNQVFPGYASWGQMARDIGSQANQNEAGGKAEAATTAQYQGAKQRLLADLSSLGQSTAPNVNNSQFTDKMIGLDVMGAAQTAAAGTGARQQQRNLGLSAMQDWVTAGMGTPTQSVAATNAASGTGQALQNQYNWQLQRDDNNLASAGRAAVDVISEYGRGAQGGLIKRGGYVTKMPQNYAGGGVIQPIMAPAPPPMPAQRPNPGLGMARAGTSMAGMGKGIAKGIEAGGKLFGSPKVEMFGRGLQLGPEQAAAAADPYKQAAAQMVEKEMGSAIPEAGTATPYMDPASLTAAQYGTQAGTEQTAILMAQDAGMATPAGEALAASAAPTVEGLAGAGAGLEAGAAVGSALAPVAAALPVIGVGLAGYGIGKAAGWWADGGPVSNNEPRTISPLQAVSPFAALAGSRSAPDEPHPFALYSPALLLSEMAQGRKFAGGGQVQPPTRFYGDGGVTPGSNQQTGAVSGPGGPKDDMVPANLSDGEFVMPRGTVLKYGLARLEKMRQDGLQYEQQMGIH